MGDGWEVIAAFAGSEVVGKSSAASPQPLDGSFRRLAEQRLELTKAVSIGFMSGD